MASFLENFRKMLKIDGVHEPTKLTDKYSIVKEINHGAFSRVYSGIDKATGKEVAIKVMNKTGIKDRQKMNIIRETAIHKSLHHPNIVKLIEFFEDSDKYCLIMELMKGGELFERIEAVESFTEEDARTIIVQAAIAVKYLHDNKIVHRDIKPENLVFSGPSLTPVKLCDFGLSKVIDDATDTPCGTVGYIAPEVAKEQRHTFGVDIWGLGCVLYALLCGFPAFYDESIPILTAKVKKGIYDFPSPWWDNISPLAIDLIKSCLTVDPQKRINIEQFLQHPWILNQASRVPLSSPAVLKGSRMKEVFDVTYAAKREEMEDFSSTVRLNGVIEPVILTDVNSSNLMAKREKKKTNATTPTTKSTPTTPSVSVST